MNSDVKLIFNEKFAEKEVCRSCKQCTGPTHKTLDTYYYPNVHLMIRNYSSSMCTKGNFTVGSAYEIALAESMNSCVGEPSNGDKNTNFWRTILGLNMPNKFKSFAWRAEI